MKTKLHDTPRHYNESHKFILAGTPVESGNYVGKNFQGWWEGCQYLRRVKDDLTKSYLIIDWNGNQRRVHHVRRGCSIFDMIMKKLIGYIKQAKKWKRQAKSN